MATRNFKQITNLGRTRAGYKMRLKHLNLAFQVKRLKTVRTRLDQPSKQE